MNLSLLSKTMIVVSCFALLSIDASIAIAQSNKEAEKYLLDFLTNASKCIECSYSFVFEEDFLPAREEREDGFCTSVGRYFLRKNGDLRRELGAYRTSKNGPIELMSGSEIRKDGLYYLGGGAERFPSKKSVLDVPHLHPFGAIFSSRHDAMYGSTEFEKLEEKLHGFQYIDSQPAEGEFVGFWHHPSRWSMFTVRFREEQGWMPVQVGCRRAEKPVDMSVKTLEEWTQATHEMYVTKAEWKNVENRWVPTKVSLAQIWKKPIGDEFFGQRHLFVDWSFGEIQEEVFDTKAHGEKQLVQPYFSQLEAEIRAAAKELNRDR